MHVREYLGISEIGQCARRVAYAHDPSVVQETPEEIRRVMDLGHLLERLRRRELLRAGTRVFGPQQEVRFGEALGHIDGFIRTPEGPLLWEAKSTTGFSITKWMKEGLPRRIAWQVAGYCSGLSALLGTRVGKVLIEVIDRTSGEVNSWTYDIPPDVVDQAQERVAMLAPVIGSCTLPEREFAAGSPECRYCPFRATCRPEAVRPEDSGEPADAAGWPGFLQSVELYQAGQQLKEEGEQLSTQAREALLKALEGHQATKARVDGSLVLWSEVSTSRLDTKALQKEQPHLYAQFLKPSSYHRLEIRR